VLRFPFASALCLALSCFGSVAIAQQEGSDPRIAARALGYAGVEAYQIGDYANAEVKLQRAFALLPVPSLGLWAARALVKVGHLVEASERYLEVTRLPIGAGDREIQKEAQLDAERERAALLPRIPTVQLGLKRATWDQVMVTIDGVPVAESKLAGRIAVNPGQRWIEVRRKGVAGSATTSTARVVVALAEGKHESVVLEVGTEKPSSSVEAPSLLGLDANGSDLPTAEGASQDEGSVDAWRTGGWASIGVGSGLLLASGVSGLLAWSKLGDFDCNQDPCRSLSRDDVEGYNSLRTFSMIGYVAGGLMVGAGMLILFEYEPTETQPSPQLSLSIGPTSATLGARF
jgi:hypothetical protein